MIYSFDKYVINQTMLSSMPKITNSFFELSTDQSNDFISHSYKLIL